MLLSALVSLGGWTVHLMDTYAECTKVKTVLLFNKLNAELDYGDWAK